MKYCKKCRRLHNDGDAKCSYCKNELKNISDKNIPVYLLSASGFELQRVKSALEDSGVPSDAVSFKHNYSAQASTGFDGSEYDILVPYSAYEKSYDICVGIGAIKEDGTEIIDDDTPFEESKENSLDKQFEEISGVKRTTIKVASAIFFFLLVALAVFGTDYIMEFIMGLF
ncbi:MAG: hypothetical protein U0L20_04690 [Ruminococcus sp.]|nr:hypothetical protein [Ruminococcus sp.]